MDRGAWKAIVHGITELDADLVTQQQPPPVGILWLLLCLRYKDWGLPRWLSGRESTCQCKRCKSQTFDPWVGNIPWRRKWQPTPVFLPGESHGQRSLAGYSPWNSWGLLTWLGPLCLLIAWFVSAQLFAYCLLRSLFGRHLPGTSPNWSRVFEGEMA